MKLQIKIKTVAEMKSFLNREDMALPRKGEIIEVKGRRISIMSLLKIELRYTLNEIKKKTVSFIKNIISHGILAIFFESLRQFLSSKL